ERRNPWDEAECGHHYARAMAAWSAIPALSGFRYHGAEKRVEAAPRIHPANFSSFWSTANGWGNFTHVVREGRLRFSLSLAEGSPACRSVSLRRAAGAESKSSARLGSRSLDHGLSRDGVEAVFTFPEDITLRPGDELALVL
ncbi:MAG: hypothetical protein HY236_12905, partial [Acidobacteria bacterium]|nr:hypothetical protein [Acidobacteriota bacterium]